MKKIIILTACMFAIGLTAYGQSSKLLEKSHRFNAKSTISKQYGAKKNIICVNNTNGIVSFILDVFNSGNNSNEFSFRGYEVYDFIAVNDTVFFCGKDLSATPHGVIGFFCISQSFLGISNVYIQNSFVAGTNRRNVNKLTDMTTYYNSQGERHIVCVGECVGGFPCVVDMYEQFFVSSMWYYTAGYVNEAYETFTDIDYVLGMYEEPYIVVSGHESSYGKYINLRFFNVNDIFAVSGMQDYRHVYCIDPYSPSDPYEWLDDEVLVSRLGYGYFGTLSYRHQDTSQSPDLANINIAVFDIHNIIQNNSLMGMVHNTDILLPGETIDRELNQLIYKSPNDTIAFLITLNGILTPERYSYFCEMKHSPRNGTVPFFYHQDTLFQGMDNYLGNNKYIMSGYVKNNAKNRMFELDTYGKYDRCPASTGLEYMEINSLAAIKQYRPFNKLAERINLTPVETSLESLELIPICIKQE